MEQDKRLWMTKREVKTIMDKDHHLTTKGVNVVSVTAHFVAEGLVRFYRLDHGWTCGECGERVTIARFRHHFNKKHGFG